MDSRRRNWQRLRQQLPAKQPSTATEKKVFPSPLPSPCTFFCSAEIFSETFQFPPGFSSPLPVFSSPFVTLSPEINSYFCYTFNENGKES